MSAPESPQPALSVNQAPDTVVVRMADGSMAGRVSPAFGAWLIKGGSAIPIGRDRVRYLRLAPGVVIEKRSTGWQLVERQRNKYGDKAITQGLGQWESGRRLHSERGIGHPKIW